MTYPGAARALRPSRVRYTVIALTVALAVITYIDRACISFAAPFIRRDLGLSAVQMGWVFTAFGLAYALFEIPGGYLGDWIGPRKVLTRIVVWWSLFTAATGWATGLNSLAATRFLFGAGEAGCFPNIAKAFNTWLPAHEKQRAQGLLWLSARWGGAFTPPLVKLVIDVVGWRHSFEIFGCIGIIWAVIFFRWFRDDPAQKPGLNDAERELLKANAKLAPGRRDVPWGRLLASRQAWLLCGQYFCHSYGFYFYMTWLPTYLREGRHLALGASALLSGLPLFMGGLGSSAGVVVSRFFSGRDGNVARGRRATAYIGFAGACGFLMLSTITRNPVAATAIIAMASFCSDLIMPTAWSSTMDVGGRFAGTLSGAMNMWGNIGGALSPLAIGYILNGTGNNWNITFYVSSAIYLVGLLCWMFLDPVTPIEPATE
jgi:MFS transporter, ACS family, glucarate transporter